MPKKGETKSVGGKSYEWNGRRWVPARNLTKAEDAGKPKRSDYDSGRSGAKKYSDAVKDYRNDGETPPTAQPPKSPTLTGRNEPRTGPGGVAQTGTSMTGRAMTMVDMENYLGKNVLVKNPFLSNALPGTNDDGFANTNTAVIATVDGELVEGGPISINEYNTQYPNDNKSIEVQSTEGSANLVQSGGVKVNDIKDSSTWTEDYARRRAFLDAEDSMSGLKAVQAQKGIVYAGGQHNLVNPNAGQEGENDFIKIDRSDAQAYMRGAQSAEDLKATYIDKIKASKPAPFENVGDTSINSSPVESPINMNESPDDFVAPLTDMPAYTDKDHTGRFNIFRRS